jgi:hypothetical protein
MKLVNDDSKYHIMKVVVFRELYFIVVNFTSSFSKFLNIHLILKFCKYLHTNIYINIDNF